MEVVWLASYPRSGNTFLRTILWHCFGLRSGSIYPNDLNGNKELEDYVGHVEHGPGNGIFFPPDGLPLIKTHEYPTDANPAIYVTRDGRAASVSLWKFYNKSISLQAVIEGRHRFGTWSAHVAAWKPWERQNTLLLEYEDLRCNLPLVLDKISHFLQRDILSRRVPDRNAIASVDGRWVRSKTDWQAEISGELLERFNEINGEMLKKMGYELGLPDMAKNKIQND
jgi:hypothetical protein